MQALSGRTDSGQMCTHLVRTCSVEGCERPVEAKGLCVMHYRRLRRTGDPLRVRKPGAPKSPGGMASLVMAEEGWSARTLAKFRAAMNLLSEAGLSDAECQRIFMVCTMRGGNLNVSKILRLSEQAYYEGGLYEDPPG